MTASPAAKVALLPSEDQVISKLAINCLSVPVSRDPLAEFGDISNNYMVTLVVLVPAKSGRLAIAKLISGDLNVASPAAADFAL